MPIVHCDHKSKNPHRNSVLRELREMQQIAYALTKDPETKPSDVAQLMRAHVAAEQQRNILRMRPAPKPIDTTTMQRKTRAPGGLRAKLANVPPNVVSVAPAPASHEPVSEPAAAPPTALPPQHD